MLGAEFLVSFTASSFSIDKYSFQRNVKCITYGDKKSVKVGQVLGSFGTKKPKTGSAYPAILIRLKSSKSLGWLNILIRIGKNQFWWAPGL